MIIVFGYSKLSAEVCYELHHDEYDFSIVEPNQKELNFAIKDNFTDKIYDYDCYDDEKFIQLGIKTKKVKTLFCLHNDFNKNLFLILSARNLNKSLQIITASNDNNETKKLYLAGATSVINPYEIAGLKIFRNIHKPISTKIIDEILYLNDELNLQEIKVTHESILNGKYFNQLDILEKYNLVLLGIQDRELSSRFHFASRGINHKIDEDDVLVVLGYQKDIDKFSLAVQ